MSYPINYPTPQGANVQIFYGNGGDISRTEETWIKPQGASFVWFTLIASGGRGDGTTGAGSGAVTNFMCPAFLIPDSLQIKVGVPRVSSAAGLDTDVIYRQKNGTGYTLLTANAGSAATAGTAMTANAFTAMGFFQSVAGQAGSSSTITASTTTFLSGGGSVASAQASNYGYTTGSASVDRPGSFQMQPIIVGIGGMGNARGGIGCGGGLSGSANNAGGPGLAVIITW